MARFCQLRVPPTNPLRDERGGSPRPGSQVGSSGDSCFGTVRRTRHRPPLHCTQIDVGRREVVRPTIRAASQVVPQHERRVAPNVAHSNQTARARPGENANRGRPPAGPNKLRSVSPLVLDRIRLAAHLLAAPELFASELEHPSGRPAPLRPGVSIPRRSVPCCRAWQLFSAGPGWRRPPRGQTATGGRSAGRGCHRPGVLQGHAPWSAMTNES